MTAGYLSKRNAAAYLDCSERWIDKLREDGSLPYYKEGRRVKFRIADLDAYIAQFRAEGQDRPVRLVPDPAPAPRAMSAEEHYRQRLAERRAQRASAG